MPDNLNYRAQKEIVKIVRYKAETINFYRDLLFPVVAPKKLLDSISNQEDQLMFTKNPTTIRHALCKLFGKRFLRQFAQVKEIDLIQCISEQQGIHPNRLLIQCAYILGLEVKTELILPTPDLIKTCGYSPAILYDKKVIPQPYKDRFCMVVADPTSLNIDEWFAFGIPIYLSLSSLIEDTWNRYFNVDYNMLKTGLQSMCKIIVEAKQKGSQELILGVNTNTSCEYNVGNEIINNEISQEVYRFLLSLFGVATKIELIVPELQHQKITITSINNSGRPVLYISWPNPRFEHKSMPPMAPPKEKDRTIQELVLKAALNGISIPYSLQ